MNITLIWKFYDESTNCDFLWKTYVMPTEPVCRKWYQPTFFWHICDFNSLWHHLVAITKTRTNVSVKENAEFWRKYVIIRIAFEKVHFRELQIETQCRPDSKLTVDIYSLFVQIEDDHSLATYTLCLNW